MNKMRQHDEEAPTQLDMRAPEVLQNSVKKTTTAPMALLADQDRVSQTGHKSRGKLLALLAAFGLGAGSGSFATYEYMKSEAMKTSSSATASSAVPTTSSSGKKSAQVFGRVPLGLGKSVNGDPKGPVIPSDDHENPEESGNEYDQPIIKTAEQLLKTLRENGIKATIDDFKTRNRFMTVLIYTQRTNEDGSNGLASWEAFSPKTPLDQQILLALRLERPEYKFLVKFVGRLPAAFAADEDDPQIIYAYYGCVESDNFQNRAAAIGIKDPSKAAPNGPFLTTLDFALSRCETTSTAK